VCRSLLEDLSLRRKLRRVRAFESFKRKKEAQVIVQKSHPREGSQNQFLRQRFLRRKLNGQNSPRRTPEIARTVGYKKVAGDVKHWIDPPSKGRIQCGPLVSIIGPSRSFQHFGVHKSEVWTKPLVDRILKTQKEVLV
jgi:hypothetical protein